MKVLNLYAGIGGNRKLWEDVEVTAVELDPQIAKIYQDFFPDDTVIVGDAHQYLLDHFKEFDFIWSSPPCPTHSKIMKFTRHNVIKYPDMALYQEIILLDNFFEGFYCVENVNPYYEPLMPSKKIGRHLFWFNFGIGNFNTPLFDGNYLKANKKQLMDYYDIHFEKNIYVKGSHDPAKILKNCTHPETGLYILNCARNIITKQNIQQIDIFE